MNRLSKLFEACNIGSLEIKNRIVMAPMVTGGYGPEGELTERIAEFYAVRARGGVGLIICQSSIIMWESRVPFRCSIYDDKFTKGFEKVAKAIHENGAKAAFQVIHHGRVLADYKHMVSHGNDIKALAPSAIPRLFSKEIQGSKDQQTQGIWAKGNAVPEEATQEDIDRVKKGFAEAGRRIKEAGFDAIEIMAGHGYLLGQFLSPLVNHRADQYGGNIENRSRFVCEVIAEIRSRVGSGFPIILRISGTDFLPGGISIDEVLGQIGFFIKSGADALHITAGEQTTSDRQYPSFIFPQGLHVSMAEAVKQKSSVPVIAVGKIHDPVFAEEILQKGKADFVAIGRPLLADPDWPNKAKEGRIGDIRPCIYCLNCINFGAHPHLLKEGISCSVNPTVLREKEFTLMTTSTPKEVMVIGGGPAGIVGATILANRGHRVELYEQDDKLGGQFYVATQQVQKKGDYLRFLQFLKRGLKKAGVDVKLNTTVNAPLIKQVDPDAVLIATGAVTTSLDVPGSDGENVVGANDLILGRVSACRSIVIVGGRYFGMELADELAEEGRRVSLVTRRELGRGMERNIYLTLRNRLIEKGVYIYPHSPVVKIERNGVYIVYNNDLVFLSAEMVVLAIGRIPKANLITELKGLAAEVYSVGDCVEPRDIMYAIREAAEAALKI